MRDWGNFYQTQISQTVLAYCGAYDDLKVGEVSNGVRGPYYGASIYGGQESYKYSGHNPGLGRMRGTNVLLMDGHISWVPRRLLWYRTGDHGLWRPHQDSVSRY